MNVQRQPRLPFWPLACLALIYGMTLAAPVIAPYDADHQDRLLPYAPPMGVHLRHPETGWQLRPWVYPADPVDGAYDVYAPDRERPTAVRFWQRDAEGQRRLFLADDGVHLHLLGTDAFGRDLFSRLLHAGRVSLWLGLAAALLSLTLGTLVGVVAGYCGGWVDRLAMRGCELLLALPWLYLLLALRAFLPLDVDGSTAMALTLALLAGIGWAAPARIIRGTVLGVRQRPFVRAARGFGASHWAVLREHVLPHVSGVVWVQLLLAVPRFILAEVTLSFFGLGMAEPFASWGTLLADAASLQALTSYSWLLSPAAAIFLVILSYHQLVTFYGRSDTASAP